MHRGRPSARHQERIAGDLLLSALMPDANRIDPQATIGAEDLGAGKNLDVRGARGVGQRPADLAPQISDQRNADASLLEIERGAIGAVMRGHDDHSVADPGAILESIAPRGFREHDARPVVVRKDQRTLDRAGRQHHLARPHLPQAFARQVGIGDEVGFGEALVERDKILRVIAERLGARHQSDVWRGAQRGERFRKPSSRALPLDLGLGLGEQRAAERGIFVADDHPRVAFARGQRRGETRWAPANDQHVAMVERARIAIRIGLARGSAEARGATDHRLIDMAPGPARTHEGLVIEARPKERRKEIVDRAEVELERGPAVLARSAKSIVKLDLGRAQIGGCAAGSARKRDQRVRLLGAGGEDAARAVIFERAPHEMEAVGDQGGRERVAGAALVIEPIEGEDEGARRVDRAAARETKRLAHAPRPARSPATSGRGSPAL